MLTIDTGEVAVYKNLMLGYLYFLLECYNEML